MAETLNELIKSKGDNCHLCKTANTSRVKPDQHLKIFPNGSHYKTAVEMLEEWEATKHVSTQLADKYGVVGDWAGFRAAMEAIKANRQSINSTLSRSGASGSRSETHSLGWYPNLYSL